MKKNIFTDKYKPLTSEEALEKIKKQLDEEQREDIKGLVFTLVKFTIEIGIGIALLYFVM